MKSVQSPEGQYTIDFYRVDAGAMGTFGIMGELNGPLWFKKNIYSERHAEQAELEWEDEHIVVINGHRLDLRELMLRIR